VSRLQSSLWVVVRAARIGYSEFWALYTWRTWLFGWFGRMLAQVAFYALIGKLLRSGPMLQYLLVGNAVFVMCIEAMVAIIGVARERQLGTLALQLAAPIGYFATYVGRSLTALLSGLVSSTGTLLLSAWIFHLDLPWPRVLLLPPLILVVGASCYALATCLGSLVLRATSAQWVVMNVAYNGLLAFGGVSVPISFWPAPLQAVAQALPMTHGLIAMRLLLGQGMVAAAWRNLGAELVVGIAWWLVAFLTFEWFRNEVRASGRTEAIV
jgi:ABC-2 type transport system permease protein